MSFEDQIRKNRGGLDQDRPDRAKMWAAVESELPRQKQKRWPWLAAAVIVGAVLGSVIFLRPNDELIAEEEVEFQLDPEFASEQVELQQQFVQTFARLAEYDYEEKDLGFFMEQIDVLNECEKDLLLRLPSAPNKTRILRDILDQYRKKIRVVEHMIRDLEKKKRHEQRNKEIA